MNNLNSVLVEGYMVIDPILKTTTKGMPVCTFSIASSRFYKKNSDAWEKEVGFFEVETWSKLAQDVSNIGRKGRGVRVVGRLRQNRWNDKEGKPHSRIFIVAEHVEFRPEFKQDTAPESEEQEALAEAF